MPFPLAIADLSREQAVVLTILCVLYVAVLAKCLLFPRKR